MDDVTYYHFTICEMHRQIYKKLEQGGSFKDVQILLENAFDMGKKMSFKLRQYNRGYDKDWYIKTKDYDGTRIDQDEPILWEDKIEVEHPAMGKSQLKV